MLAHTKAHLHGRAALGGFGETKVDRLRKCVSGVCKVGLGRLDRMGKQECNARRRYAHEGLAPESLERRMPEMPRDAEF